MPSTLVIGGGPAGLAAAWAAVQSGDAVTLLDDNPALGGQIWRGEIPARYRRFLDPRITIRTGVQIHSATQLPKADRIILATGTRERFLPFPGWTLPHVLGAGGLQAMVKSGLPIAGKRVVVAGAGPLLLAVAAYLRKRGAKIVLVAEQAPYQRVSRFTQSLWRTPGKLLQAAQLALGLRYRTDAWPLRADPGSVTIQGHGVLPCDYLACGFGLVTNTELPELLGCRVDTGAVITDSKQRTTVPHIHFAGAGSVDRSILEGQIAGFDLERARALYPARDAAVRFDRRIDEAFQLRSELSTLATPETIICRCEDVPFSAVWQQRDWRSAKLQTRCGMGPCQGRICGPALEHLCGWPAASVRPPIFPTRLENLLDLRD